MTARPILTRLSHTAFALGIVAGIWLATVVALVAVLTWLVLR